MFLRRTIHQEHTTIIDSTAFGGCSQWAAIDPAYCTCSCGSNSANKVCKSRAHIYIYLNMYVFIFLIID